MPKKILIIDDADDVSELTQRVLTTRGYQVITLADGSQVFETLQTQKPDLIILDMLLPDKNGDEICHEIKSDSNYKHIPIIITTGQAIVDESQQEIPGLLRPDDYLPKPFEIEELLDKIENLLH